MTVALEMTGVSKVYGVPPNEVHALRDVNLRIETGELVAIMGPSGSGKSTLLTIAGSLEQHDDGKVQVGGVDLATMLSDDRARLRRRSIGYVFQDFNLLPGLTALENVKLPLELDGIGSKTARVSALATLTELGLEQRVNHFPDELSGGERQRVAIARAVVGDRFLLLADEPTGALDSTNSEAVIRLVRRVCQRGVAGLIVTHDAQLTAWVDRIIYLHDGCVVEQHVVANNIGAKP